MEHTPGPWHIDGTPGLEALEIHSPTRRIAKSLYHRESEDREADANARLIAAAPDLLAACEFWLGAVQNSLGLRLALTSLPEGAGPALVEMLQEAIAKTRGETEGKTEGDQ